VRGPNGANDEFIEIYNNSDTSTTVASQVGSGFAVAASDAVVRCTIPNGTVIPGADTSCAPTPWLIHWQLTPLPTSHIRQTS